MSSYYEILGVGRNATKAEIRKAYRKLAIRWHPDKNPDNKEEARKMFQKIGEAYDVLSDDDKRREYDMSGGRSSGGFSSSGGFNSSGRTSRRPFRTADDIFREFFGGRDPFSSFFEDDGFFGGDPFGRRGSRDMFGGGGSRDPFGGRGFGGGGFFSSGFDSMFDDEVFNSTGSGTRSVSTSTSTVVGPDGVRRTTTTRIVRHADGRVETTRTATEDRGRLEDSRPRRGNTSMRRIGNSRF